MNEFLTTRYLDLESISVESKILFIERSLSKIESEIRSVGQRFIWHTCTFSFEDMYNNNYQNKSNLEVAKFCLP